MLPHYYRKYLSYQKRLEIKLMHFSLDIYIYSYIYISSDFLLSNLKKGTNYDRVLRGCYFKHRQVKRCGRQYIVLFDYCYGHRLLEIIYVRG